MGWLTSLTKGVSSVVRTVAKVPGIKALPVVGSAIAVGSAAMDIFGPARAAAPGGMGGMPALPGFAGGGALPTSSPIPMGDRAWWRNDPNVAKYLEAFAIPKSALRPSFRAPHGYIVLRDQVGDPYGIPKVVARALKMWKAKPKPPISVRDWHSLQRADATVKKLKKVVQKANKIKGVHVGGHHAAPKKGKK